MGPRLANGISPCFFTFWGVEYDKPFLNPFCFSEKIFCILLFCAPVGVFNTDLNTALDFDVESSTKEVSDKSVILHYCIAPIPKASSCMLPSSAHVIHTGERPGNELTVLTLAAQSPPPSVPWWPLTSGVRGLRWESYGPPLHLIHSQMVHRAL